MYSRRKNIPLPELYIGSSWEQIEKKPPHSGAPLPPASTKTGHPALDVSTQASYHRIFDSCIPKWLNQAGVKTHCVKLEAVGITGNEHELMLDKNSDQIAKFFVQWLGKNVK